MVNGNEIDEATDEKIYVSASTAALDKILYLLTNDALIGFLIA